MEKASATIVDADVKVSGIDANHREMTKFGSRENEGYQMVLDVLTELVEKIMAGKFLGPLLGEGD